MKEREYKALWATPITHRKLKVKIAQMAYSTSEKFLKDLSEVPNTELVKLLGKVNKSEITS